MTVLSERGAPTPVAVTRLRAPESLMGPVGEDELDRVVRASPAYERYAQAVDRESAYERLTGRATGAKGPDEVRGGGAKGPDEVREGRSGGRAEPKGEGEERDSLVEQVADSGVFKSLARSLGSQIGREITRSVFGTARRRRR